MRSGSFTTAPRNFPIPFLLFFHKRAYELECSHFPFETECSLKLKTTLVHVLT